MPKLKAAHVNFLNEVFQPPDGAGYVLNFSDRTFVEYFDAEFDIDISDQKYFKNGTSKMKRLRAFIELEDAHTVTRVLRNLWEHRDSIYGPFNENDANVGTTKRKFFELLDAIDRGSDIPKTDAIDRFAQDETLEELVTAIQRDIQANKPQAALDRLHTYCMKKFAHLLEQNGYQTNKEEALHSRAGRYIKLVEAKGGTQDITLKIMKSSIAIFDSFNATRNNASFAHDNELVEKHEARFIFDSVVSILRFLKSVETSRFGQ